MNKKDAKGAGDDASLEKTIAELFHAIEQLESSNKRPGEGILADARELAAQWTINKRALFEGLLGNNRLLLLVALVEALRQDHQLLKTIRRYRPAELENLIKAAGDDWFREMVDDWWRKRPKPTPKEHYEMKRRRPHQEDVGLIVWDFGHWRGQRPRTDPPWAKYLPLPESVPSTVLDDIFAGDTVNMLRLEELFGMDRHRFAEPLRGVQKRRYDYFAVVNIMDFFLKEDSRKKRKHATPGRPQRMPWLNDLDLRRRVLSGIEARIKSIPIKEEIADAFLTVIRRHLPDSGKK